MQKFSAMNAHGFRVAARCLPDRSHYSRGSLGRSPGLIRGSGEGDVPPPARRPYVGDWRRPVRVGSISWERAGHRQRMGFLAAMPKTGACCRAAAPGWKRRWHRPA